MKDGLFKVCVVKSTDPFRWTSVRADYRAAWLGGQGFVNFRKKIKIRCLGFLFRQAFMDLGMLGRR